MVYRSTVPPRSLTKTSLVPSGDHAGCELRPAPWVSRRVAFVAIFVTKMSEVSWPSTM
jgi:hypothetical protein